MLCLTGVRVIRVGSAAAVFGRETDRHEEREYPMTGRAGLWSGIVLVGVAAVAPAFGDEAGGGWKDSAELSFVATDGNSETSTFGFKNKLWREWDRSSFTVKAGAVRSESTDVDRTQAIAPDPGNLSSFFVIEERTTRTTADSAFLNGRYDRTIRDGLFWFAGAGWDRNRPAGINDRFNGFGGVGNVWVDTETVKFNTDYSVTFTSQDDVTEAPGVEDNFVGARFAWTYWHRFTDTTTYGNDFVLDENLKETSDLRADMTNWLQVSINKRVALKVGLQWLFDNEPSFEEVPLFAGTPPAPTGTTVFVELDELDSIFTTSLVIDF